MGRSNGQIVEWKEVKEAFRNVERIRKEQARIEDKQLAGRDDTVKKEAMRRRIEIAGLEGERTRAEYDLEIALLEMLCAMGFVSDDWAQVRARNGQLQAAITGWIYD